MATLEEQTCSACRGDLPPLSLSEATDLLSQLQGGWNLDDDKGVNKLAKRFTFNNFANAMAFANRVGELAEAHNHHPLLCVTWGEVTVVWWTHKIGGLHKNDFILAAKTDGLEQI